MGTPVPQAFVNLPEFSITRVTDVNGKVTFMNLPIPRPVPFTILARVFDSQLPERFSTTEKLVVIGDPTETFVITVTIAVVPPPEPEVPEEEVATLLPPPPILEEEPVFGPPARDVPTQVAIEPLKALYKEAEDVIVRLAVVRIDAQSAIPNVPVDILVDGNFALRTSTGAAGFNDINLGPLGPGLHEILGRFGGLAIELVSG